MKKLFAFILITPALFASIYESHSGYCFGYQALTYDEFVLNLSCPTWQPREYYYGILPTSIGYFHVNNMKGSINIYGSNRYIEEDDVDLFRESLEPLSANLLPYATPNGGKALSSQIVKEECASISGLSAKKITFELELPCEKVETVITYLFTRKTDNLLLPNHGIGYTYSVSCEKESYSELKETIDDIFQRLRMMN